MECSSVSDLNMIAKRNHIRQKLCRIINRTRLVLEAIFRSLMGRAIFLDPFGEQLFGDLSARQGAFGQNGNTCR